MSKLIASKCKPAEFARTIYFAPIDHGIELDVVLRPDFWAHAAAKLKPMDRIEVAEESGKYWAELIVLSVGKSEVHVKVFREHDLQAKKSNEIDIDGYEVSWGGPHNKHRVVRKSDKEVIKSGFGTKEEAQLWLADHLKA